MPDKKYILKSAPLNQRDFKIDYKKELNPEQYEVVTKADGPCLVLAGAGSGKTRTLVYRVVYLLEQGIAPKNIMLVTFTNKAAREMLERIEVILRGEAKGLWGGTFHHIGNRILRIYGEAIGIANNFTILDEEDSLTLVKNCLSRTAAPADKYFPKAKVVKSIISMSVNLCRPIRQTMAERYDYLKPEYCAYILEASEIYAQRKKSANALDFDDLLLKWNELLEKSPAVKSKLGRQFQYILVDEFQDTNYLQNKIIANLAEPQRNILAVGDDAQSIYAFRGADVNNILTFPKLFADARTFRLDINYRSTPEILKFANSSINLNEKKFEKNLTAVKSHGSEPAVAPLDDNYEQARFVCQRILDLQREKEYGLNDLAVLFRSHFQSLELEMELNKRNIPYQMRGGLKFFEQAHLKDITAYLKILANFNDEISWLRILNLYPGIGQATAEKIWKQISTQPDLAKAVGYNFGLTGKAGNSLNDALKTIGKLLKVESSDLSVMVKTIIDRGYDEYLKSNYENYQERLEDLNQLMEFIGSYDNLEKFLSDTALAENFRGETAAETGENDESLVLSTIHQAKGLEWKAVFVIGLSEGQFPHAKVYDKPQELEEERRLFYVACTRAKDELYLTYPIFGMDSILRPSQFITELSPSLYDRWDVSEEDAEDIIYVDEDGEQNDRWKNGKKKLLDFKL